MSNIIEFTGGVQYHNPNDDKKMIPCYDCDGRGYNIWSCCGDDISETIDMSDLCPSCLEHCGDEKERCETCEGTGEVEN